MTGPRISGQRMVYLVQAAELYYSIYNCQMNPHGTLLANY